MLQSAILPLAILSFFMMVVKILNFNDLKRTMVVGISFGTLIKANSICNNFISQEVLFKWVETKQNTHNNSFEWQALSSGVISAKIDVVLRRQHSVFNVANFDLDYPNWQKKNKKKTQ